MTPQDEFAGQFAAIFQSLAEQQMTVLAWIAADPAALVDCFERAGGERDLFLEQLEQRGDLDAIYVAFAHSRDTRADREAAQRFARITLQNAGCWRDGDGWGGGAWWTEKRLAWLFESTYPSDVTVESHTAKLIKLARRIRAAAAHLERARELLDETPADIAARAQRINDPRLIDSSPRASDVAVRIFRRKGNGVCHAKLI